MSHLIFVLITLGWVSVTWHLVNSKPAVIWNDLRIHTILLGLAWSGFNAVFALLTLFDFLERAPSTLILSFPWQEDLMFSFILCFCNITCGFYLVVRLLLSAKAS